MEEEELSDDQVYKSIVISEDAPASNTKEYVNPGKKVDNACQNCSYLTENAEKAWSMMTSYVKKLSQLQTLKNENQQLSRINAEQQIYLASQREKFRDMENEVSQSQLKIAELEDRLRSTNGQYKQILAKVNEAQEAANMWREKYDASQILLIDLEKKSKENHKLHISSVAVAATFSKNQEMAEAKSTLMESKLVDLQRQNNELLQKISDLEARFNALEGSKSIKHSVAKKPRLDTNVDYNFDDLFDSFHEPLQDRCTAQFVTSSPNRSDASFCAPPPIAASPPMREFNSPTEVSPAVSPIRLLSPTKAMPSISAALASPSSTAEIVEETSLVALSTSNIAPSVTHAESSFASPKHSAKTSRSTSTVSSLESVEGKKQKLSFTKVKAEPSSSTTVATEESPKISMTTSASSAAQATSTSALSLPPSPKASSFALPKSSPRTSHPSFSEPLVLSLIENTKQKPSSSAASTKLQSSPLKTVEREESPKISIETSTQPTSSLSLPQSSKAPITSIFAQPKLPAPKTTKTTLENKRRTQKLSKKKPEFEISVLEIFAASFFDEMKVPMLKKYEEINFSENITLVTKETELIEEPSEPVVDSLPTKEVIAPKVNRRSNSSKKKVIAAPIAKKATKNVPLAPVTPKVDFSDSDSSDHLLIINESTSLEDVVAADISLDKVQSSSSVKVDSSISKPSRSRRISTAPSTAPSTSSSVSTRSQETTKLGINKVAAIPVQQKKVAQLIDIPAPKSSKKAQQSVENKNLRKPKKSANEESLTSLLLSHFQQAMTKSGRLNIEGVYASLFKANVNLSQSIDVDKLADIMCRSVLEANVGDLWVSLKAQTTHAFSSQHNSEMVLSNMEKNFFQFANQLLSEPGWQDLFKVFSKKLALEVLKSVNQPEPSVQQVCRNFRILAGSHVFSLKLKESEMTSSEDGATLRDNTQDDTILNLITLLLNNHAPSVFVPVFCYLITIDAHLITNKFLELSNSSDEAAQKHKLLRLHFTDAVDYVAMLSKLSRSRFSLDFHTCFTDVLLIGPSEGEVVNWIMEKMEEIKQLPNGFNIQGDNQFRATKVLLEKIRDCVALFAPKFKIEINRFSIVTSSLEQLLSLMSKTTGQDNILSDVSAEDLPASGLFSETYPTIRTRSATKKNFETANTTAMVLKLNIADAMSTANMAMLTGRFITPFLMNAHIAERPNYVAKIASFTEQVNRLIETMKSIAEKNQLPDRTPVNLVSFGVDQMLRGFSVFQKLR